MAGLTSVHVLTTEAVICPTRLDFVDVGTVSSMMQT